MTASGFPIHLSVSVSLAVKRSTACQETSLDQDSSWAHFGADPDLLRLVTVVTPAITRILQTRDPTNPEPPTTTTDFPFPSKASTAMFKHDDDNARVVVRQERDDLIKGKKASVVVAATSKEARKYLVKEHIVLLYVCQSAVSYRLCGGDHTVLCSAVDGITLLSSSSTIQKTS